MASTSATGISSGHLRTFRYEYTVKKWGQRVMAAVFKSCFLGGNNPDPIKEQLKRINSNYNRSTCKWFVSHELEKIENNVPLHEYDITLLNKIFRKFWDKNVGDPGDTLKDLLKKIKDERNRVSHESLSFTPEELANELEEFECTLYITLSEATSLNPPDEAVLNQLCNDVNEDIRMVQEKIRENLDPSNPEDVEQVKEEIELFIDLLRNDIKEKSRSDLIFLYERICKMLPFAWLPQYKVTDLSKIAVSLMMDTDQALDHNQFGNQPTILDQCEILTTKDPNGKDPDVVIISGDAGTGKSTLLSFITEKWRKEETHDFPGLSSYKILLRTEFRSNAADNFDDYLRKLLRDAMMKYGDQYVISSILNSKCLFLCDGFDEANVKSMKLFRKILDLNCSNMKIIVTTRPVHKTELTKMVNKSKRESVNLSLLGLTEKSQISLVTKLTNYLIKDDTQRRQIVDEITESFDSIKPEMKALLKTPLYMSVYVLLLSKSPKLRDSLTTSTKLFIKLMEHCSSRLVEKLENTDKDSVLKFEKVYKQESLRNHLGLRYELTEKENIIFKNKCTELGLPFSDVISTYFTTKLSFESEHIIETYCYRHRLEQEFAAAGGICDRIRDIHQDTDNKGNIISLILSEVKKEMKEEDKSEGKSSSDDNKEKSEGESSDGNEEKSEGESSSGDADKKDLQKILGFVTGILYNSDQKLLERVIKDILHMIYREYDDYGVLNIDTFLHQISETEGSKSIGNVVINILEGEKDKGFWVKDGKNASFTRMIVDRIRPSSLKIELKDDPNTYPDLISAIKATHTHRVLLKLHLNSHYYGQVEGYSDELYKAGCFNVVEFTGSLSKTTIVNFLNESQRLERLDLRVDNLASVEAVTSFLPLLNQLSDLTLSFPFEESTDPKPIVYTGTTLSIIIDHLGKGDTKAKQLAMLLNALWTNRTQTIGETRNRSFDFISINNSHFTKAGVQELVSTLELKDLGMISVFGTTNINEDETKELEHLSTSRGLTSSSFGLMIR